MVATSCHRARSSFSSAAWVVPLRIQPTEGMPTSIDVFAKAREHERLEQLRVARELGALPYFRVLEGPTLPVVEMEGSAGSCSAPTTTWA